jgi:DNA-3-methyladenine glycosylase
MNHSSVGEPLAREFFERDPDDVARALIGTLLVVRGTVGEHVAMIVETEAYGGRNDPASHAFRGPTKRNAIMFGPAGYLYVYLIYGVHWCMNVVTEFADEPSAVLLRGAQLLSGSGSDLSNGTALRGPGNLTKGLGITGDDSGLDCCADVDARLSFHRSLDVQSATLVDTSARIGLSVEKDRPSRYFLRGHPAVSKLVVRRT